VHTANAVGLRQIYQLLPKQSPAPAQTRRHRANGNIQYPCRFYIRKLLHVDQQNDGSEVLRDFCQGSQHLFIRDLLWKGRATSRGLFQDVFTLFDHSDIQPFPAVMVKSVKQNLE